MSSGAHTPPSEGAFSPYALVRELGARPLPAYAVRQIAAIGAKPHLFVAERFVSAARGPDGKDSSFVREARRIAALTSPNLPRVRDVAIHGDDVLVFTEIVDGEKLETLWRPEALPLEIALRAIVDVLAGVSALHNLRDARQQPLKLTHGEISPATIVFGLDGVARVLHAIARRFPEGGALPDPSSVRCMAPEVLAGEPYDQRADVYGAGVLLWEALSGRPLYTDSEPAAVVAHTRGQEAPRASLPATAPWAKDLVEVAARALRASPDERWPTAAGMAGELRKASGLKLAAVSTTAAFAKSAIAERAKARRQDLETRPATIPPQPAPPAKTPIAGPVAAPPAFEPRVVQSAALPAQVDAVGSPPMDALLPHLETAPEPEHVLVAPGIHAPVSEVIELGSESLLEAADSMPPPVAPEAAGLDPFNLPQLPPQAPVALPAPAPVEWMSPASHAPVEPAIAHAAAAVSIEAAEPFVRQPMETAPSMVRQSEQARVTARRKVLVLGGVGALGGLILVLALIRWAARDTKTHATATRPVVVQIAPSAIAASTPTTLPPLPAPVATRSAPPVGATSSAAAVAGTPGRSAPAAHPPKAPGAHPGARPASSPRPKKPKPAFDPNTL